MGFATWGETLARRGLAETPACKCANARPSARPRRITSRYVAPCSGCSSIPTRPWISGAEPGHPQGSRRLDSFSPLPNRRRATSRSHAAVAGAWRSKWPEAISTRTSSDCSMQPTSSIVLHAATAQLSQSSPSALARRRHRRRQALDAANRLALLARALSSAREFHQPQMNARPMIATRPKVARMTLVTSIILARIVDRSAHVDSDPVENGGERAQL